MIVFGLTVGAVGLAAWILIARRDDYALTLYRIRRH
jgi:hypothetical protein